MLKLKKIFNNNGKEKFKESTISIYFIFHAYIV